MDLIKKSSVVEVMRPDTKIGYKWTSVETLNYEVVTYMEGAEFPLKTFPSPDALWATNLVKKIIIESLKVFPLSLGLNLIFKKSLQKLLDSFNRVAYGALQPYFYYSYIKPNLQLTNSSRGVGKIIDLFLIYYGINKEISHKTAELLAHIVEYDSFYRFKLLDILSEADEQHLIENPRKEIQRLLKICYDREEILDTYIRPKLKILSYLAWVLVWPPVKKAFKQAIELSTLELFKIDEIDYYWLLLRDDYHYLGKSPKERMDILKEKGWKLPTQYERSGTI